jgi:hypothetical protein
MSDLDESRISDPRIMLMGAFVSLEQIEAGKVYVFHEISEYWVGYTQRVARSKA